MYLKNKRLQAYQLPQFALSPFMLLHLIVSCISSSVLFSSHHQMWPITCPICLMYLISLTVPSPGFSLSLMRHTCMQRENLPVITSLSICCILALLQSSLFRLYTTSASIMSVHHCYVWQRDWAQNIDVKIRGQQQLWFSVSNVSPKWWCYLFKLWSWLHYLFIC